MNLTVDKSINQFKQLLKDKTKSKVLVTFLLNDTKILDILNINIYLPYDILNIICEYSPIVINVNCIFYYDYEDIIYSIHMYTTLTSFVVFNIKLDICSLSYTCSLIPNDYEYGGTIKYKEVLKFNNFNNIIFFNEFIKTHGNIKDVKRNHYFCSKNDPTLRMIYFDDECGIFKIPLHGYYNAITILDVSKMKIIIEIIKILIDNSLSVIEQS